MGCSVCVAEGKIPQLDSSSVGELVPRSRLGSIRNRHDARAHPLGDTGRFAIHSENRSSLISRTSARQFSVCLRTGTCAKNFR
jgi:hypothetical protein